MVKALDRKLICNLLHLKGAVLTIALIVACGVASFIALVSTYKSLKYSQESYYNAFRFADVFAHLSEAPELLKTRIQAIHGVTEVQTRLVLDVPLSLPGRIEPAIGRLVSIPDAGLDSLNRLYIRDGKRINEHDDAGVLINQAFAEANGLHPGDTMAVLVRGRSIDLYVSGIALSPEYVYAMRAGDFMPDDKRFGVLWMRRSTLAFLAGMQGKFNDVVISVTRPAIQDDVVEELDRVLQRYGGLGSHGRKRQLSNRYLVGNITALESPSVAVPVVFFVVAIFVLNMVLSRLVGTQREQIATLKALGYSDIAVGIHFLKLVLVVVLLGVAIGIAAGASLGLKLTMSYANLFRFPSLNYRIPLDVVGLAFALSLAAGLLGAMQAVLHVVRLPPAVAMRPESPLTYRPTWFDRIRIAHRLAPSTKMILRSVGKSPLRTALSALGVALAIALVVLSSFFSDAMKRIVDVQFRFSEREDATIFFSHPLPQESLDDVQRLPGIQQAEGFRAVPARLRARHVDRYATVLGLDPKAQLRRLADCHYNTYPIPQDGLLLTRKLANVLGVVPGDTVSVEPLEGARDPRPILVAGLVDEPLGSTAYASISFLRGMMGEAPVISGADLKVDWSKKEALFRSIKQMPHVSRFVTRDALIHSFETTVRDYVLASSTTLVAFGIIIVFGIIYNNARVATAERQRELMTLRLLGFSQTEVSLILLGELAIQVLLAIPMGCLLGYVLAAAISHTYDYELYRVPLVVERSTYVFASILVVCAAACTAWFVQRKLACLDFLEMLKTRE